MPNVLHALHDYSAHDCDLHLVGIPSVVFAVAFNNHNIYVLKVVVSCDTDGKIMMKCCDKCYKYADR